MPDKKYRMLFFPSCLLKHDPRDNSLGTFLHELLISIGNQNRKDPLHQIVVIVYAYQNVGVKVTEYGYRMMVPSLNGSDDIEVSFNVDIKPYFKQYNIEPIASGCVTQTLSSWKGFCHAVDQDICVLAAHQDLVDWARQHEQIMTIDLNHQGLLEPQQVARVLTKIQSTSPYRLVLDIDDTIILRNKSLQTRQLIFNPKLFQFFEQLNNTVGLQKCDILFLSSRLDSPDTDFLGTLSIVQEFFQELKKRFKGLKIDRFLGVDYKNRIHCIGSRYYDARPHKYEYLNVLMESLSPASVTIHVDDNRDELEAFGENVEIIQVYTGGDFTKDAHTIMMRWITQASLKQEKENPSSPAPSKSPFSRPPNSPPLVSIEPNRPNQPLSPGLFSSPLRDVPSDRISLLDLCADGFVSTMPDETPGKAFNVDRPKSPQFFSPFSVSITTEDEYDDIPELPPSSGHL